MKNHKKGFVVQGIIAIAALLLLGGGAYVISQKQKNTNLSPEATSDDISTKVKADLPKDWKTYINNQNGYEIKHPANWKIEENLGVSVRLINPKKQGKSDTDQPSEAVTVSFKQTPCKESSWEVGFALMNYFTACVSSGNGQTAEIMAVAFDKEGKNTEEKIISSFKPNPINTTPALKENDWKSYRNKSYGFEFQYPTKEYAIDEIQRESAGFTTITSVYEVPPPIEFGANFSVGVKQLSARPADFELYVKNLFGNTFIDSKWVSVQMQDWLKVRTRDSYFEKETSINYFALRGNQIFRIYYFPIGSSNEKDFEKIFSSFKFLGSQDAIIIKPSITVTGISTLGDKVYPGSKVPFLNFSIKASDKDVTINSFVFQKRGTLRNSALTKIILIDNNGIELAQGNQFTQYDSLTIVKPITIKAGETKNFWLYVWISSDLSTTDKDKYANLAISGINLSDEQNVNVLGNWAVMSNPMRVDLLEDKTPTPILNDINPSMGSVGTTFTITGQNLNGFEGTTYLTLINQNGDKGVIEANSYLPQGSTNLKFVLPSQICTVSIGGSGKPCPSYLTITPGAYKIFAQPWSKQSNQLNVTITASNSQSITE